jgi:hypothetical protein
MKLTLDVFGPPGSLLSSFLKGSKPLGHVEIIPAWAGPGQRPRPGKALYEVTLDGKVIGSVEYSDDEGTWSLVNKAVTLIAFRKAAQ